MARHTMKDDGFEGEIAIALPPAKRTPTPRGLEVGPRRPKI